LTYCEKAALAWFIIKAKSKREAYAKDNLELRQLTAFLPLIVEPRYAGLAPKPRPSPLFPGYLFVYMELPLDYHRVIWTPGVQRLVSLGDGPAPVPDSVVEEIRNRCDPRGVIHMAPAIWKPGDRVEVPSGPFAGVLATVVTVVPKRRRIKLLIDFLSRQTCVEMPILAFEPAPER